MRNKNTVIFHPRVEINKDHKALKYRQSSIDFNKKEEEINRNLITQKYLKWRSTVIMVQFSSMAISFFWKAIIIFIQSSPFNSVRIILESGNGKLFLLNLSPNPTIGHKEITWLNAYKFSFVFFSLSRIMKLAFTVQNSCQWLPRTHSETKLN